MKPSVAVLLVSHDGARWLPAVIDGLRAQRAAVDRVVAVDTGSEDDSVDLLTSAFGEVVELPARTSFPAAVSAGLDHTGPVEWVWILHDDANPDPGALEALLSAAADHPEADVLGPKLREWPSLRRLLELGVTISGTGRRETGLERGEYDQGQHEEVRPVLAVNTAGMLARREVLEKLGGFDPELPVFGNDVDFGWRAAAAGHRTIVVPQAVVFHAEAAHRGLRRTPLTGRHTHFQERRGALYTLLANSPARSLPFQVVRLALGTLLRAIGFLLVRSVGEALDELAALVSIYSRPGLLRAARRRRRSAQADEAPGVRQLLAPRWLPYRHGLDAVGDLASALTHQAQDVADRRRAAQHPESGAPAAGGARDDDPAGAPGLLVRTVTSPVAMGLLVFVVLAVVGAREAFGAVSGGALSPAPDQAGDWWRLHLDTWHPLAQGTAVPAPAYVLPLAAAATVAGGSPGFVVSALLVLAVPLSLWGAWRFLGVVGRLVDPRGFSAPLLAWGAATYALLPVVSGAWGQGRFGLVVAAVLLPWLAHAALGFADPQASRRWRAGWRSGLLFALTAAFAPPVFWFGVLLAVVVVGVGFAISARTMRDRSVWGPPVAAVLTAVALLAPWWLPAVLHGAAPALVLDAGRLPMEEVAALDLLTGRIGDSGAPGWLGLVLVLLAVAALVPARTRIPVLVCWIVALVSAALAVGLSLFGFHLASVTTGAGLGFPVLALQAAFVAAAVLGAHGFRPDGWAPAVALVAAVAVAVPASGLAWFVLAGESQLGADQTSGVPVYMVQNAELAPERGVLVVRGTIESGFGYTVVRDDGLTVGEDEVVGLTDEDTALSADVRSLAAGPDRGAVRALAGHGVEYVVLPAPADGRVAAVLDSTAGLVQASAESRSTRAWRVGAPVDPEAVDGPGSRLRVGLLLLQALAILVVAVLCAPTTDRRRAG